MPQMQTIYYTTHAAFSHLKNVCVEHHCMHVESGQRIKPLIGCDGQFCWFKPKTTTMRQ